MSVSVFRRQEPESMAQVFGAVRFRAGKGMACAILPGCDGEFFVEG